MKFLYQILIFFLLGNLFLLGDIPHQNKPSLFDTDRFQLEETPKSSYQSNPIISPNHFEGTHSGIRGNSTLAKTVTQENFLNHFFSFAEYSFQSIQKAYFKTYSANYLYHSKKAKRYLRFCNILI